MSVCIFTTEKAKEVNGMHKPYKEMTDYELAIASGKGDMAAFEELYVRHHRRVYSICLKMNQNVAEAEDLTQECFIQLHRKAGSFEGKSAFTTWLHRLVVNQNLMNFRKKRSPTRGGNNIISDEYSEEINVSTHDPRKPPPILDRVALDQAMEKLPPGYRQAFILHDVMGLEHPEIADMLGVAVGTSKSQLHKARMKLRRILKDRGVSLVPSLA